MGEIRTVGIKELKNKLSAYLREVRRGTRVLVSDRDRVVAELREPRTGYAAGESLDPRLAEWIDGGVVTPPAGPKRKLPPSPVRLPDGVARQLLDDDRGESGE